MRVPAGVGIFLVLAAVVTAAIRPVRGQADAPRIWQGVFTKAQADRGRETYTAACIRCHGGDLGGTTAPALKGERFMASWGGDHLGRLFEKIRDTMPPNFSTTLDAAAKLDIIAYILEANGYPAGPRDLPAAAGELSSIVILRQGEEPRAQNFALVRTIGCLERDGGNRWVLTRTADPQPTQEHRPAPDALAAAASAPLGRQTFLLLSAAPFNPAAHQGAKMEARGLVYLEPGDARLTLTSLTPVGSCP